jgi:hypothetical protein
MIPGLEGPVHEVALVEPRRLAGGVGGGQDLQPLAAEAGADVVYLGEQIEFPDPGLHAGAQMGEGLVLERRGLPDQGDLGR